MVLALVVTGLLSQEQLTAPPPPPRMPLDGEAAVEPPPPEVDAVQPRPKLIPLKGFESTRFKYNAKLDVPAGFHVVSQPRWALVVTGAGIFATTYAVSALLGAASGWGLVPIVGPAYLAGTMFASLACARCGGGFGPLIFVFGLSMVSVAIFQAGGIALSVVGAVIQRKWLERDEATRPSASIVPFINPQGPGLALVGRF